VALAQAAAVNAEITGIVLDPNGAAVQNATVQVENLNTEYGRATKTFAGLYRVPLLPLGEYSLTVEAGGFAPYTRNGILLNAGATATIDVSLQLASVAAEVVVSSGAPIVGVGPYGPGQHAVGERRCEPASRFP
jgi:hypothetical protein